MKKREIVELLNLAKSLGWAVMVRPVDREYCLPVHGVRVRAGNLQLCVGVRRVWNYLPAGVRPFLVRPDYAPADNDLGL